MRLTLRTLLAWLDTVLAPDEQKALGEKVAASPVAPQLIARLRDVVERPVLPAPRPDGRGLGDDANTVAEYLDNTLPADQLETFERICLESDVQLAEVAACHGLLAELGRDPYAVGPLDTATRRRLLEAIRHQVRPPAGRPRSAATADNVAAAWPPPVTVGPDGACDTVLGSSPQPAPRPAVVRRRAPLAAWLSAAVALVLLVTLGGLLVWSLGRERGRRLAARKPPAPVAEPAAPATAVAAVAPVAAPVVPAAKPPAPEKPPPAPVPPAPVAVVDPPAAVAPNEPPAPAIPAPEKPPPAAAPVAVAPAEQPRVPQGDALAIAAPMPAPAAAPRPDPDRDLPPAAAPAEPPDDGAGLVTGTAVLLHKAAAEPAVHGQSGWAALPRNQALAAREELLAPPFCRPEVRVGGVTIRLEPDTRATLSRDADGGPRLEVIFGRAVVQATAAGARLGITANGLRGVIADGLRSPVGIEVALERAPGADPATATRTRATVAATATGVAWRQSTADGGPATTPLAGIPAQGLLEAGSRLAWDSLDPGAIAVQARVAIPDWLAGPPRPDRVEQTAAAALAAKAAADPLEKGLRELADDRRSENRVAAVATLALLGDYDELVALLSAETLDRKLEDRQWSRLVDMTVPLALARGANAADRLAKAFENRGPAGKGAELAAIARGFDDGALEAGADARLVAALDAPELVLRRFAIRALCEIVQPSEADRSRYRPDRRPDPRRDGVAWWRKQLDEGRIRWSAVAPPR